MKAPSPKNGLLIAALAAGAVGGAPALEPAAPVPPAHDFDHVVTGTFWQQLYPAGGFTLMCGEHFDATRHTADGHVVTVDLMYPLADMMAALGCRDRGQCRARHGEKFMRMESDLHNMYPELQELVTHRIGRAFGIVDGEESRIDGCDVEWRNGILEPRELARGNIARAVLYMRATYGLPLGDAMLDLFKAWNRDDPPSRQELERNGAIEALQGRRNAFIDRPEVVENLRNLQK
jgi:deoxyribonuclease-1